MFGDFINIKTINSIYQYPANDFQDLLCDSDKNCGSIRLISQKKNQALWAKSFNLFFFSSIIKFHTMKKMS